MSRVFSSRISKGVIRFRKEDLNHGSHGQSRTFRKKSQPRILGGACHPEGLRPRVRSRCVRRRAPITVRAARALPPNELSASSCLSAVAFAKADQLSSTVRPRRRGRTNPWRGFRSRCGRRPWRGSRCGRRTSCSGRCRRSGRRWRYSRCRRRCRSPAWRHTNEIDVLLLLSPARVEVKRGRVCDIAPGVIGHNGDVIAYLLLNRPAFQRIEGIAHSYIRRPGNTAIGAVGIE